MLLSISLLLLIASVVLAVVRKSVTSMDLALWAIATALILPDLVHITPR